MRRMRFAIALWMCAGCGVDAGAPTKITAGDPALYAGYVQPYLEARCASLDCHGDSGRPLRLYSELGLRRHASLREAPISEGTDPSALTDEELEDNRLAFAAVALASTHASEHLALLKPLALANGGIAHKGRVHWASKEDPGYLCLRGYLVGDVAQDLPRLCSQALDATTAP